FSVTSELSEGSCFSFTLPVGRAVPEIVPGKAAAVHVSPNTQVLVEGKSLILVVDDEPLARELLTRDLESAGYATEAVGSGADAVQKARKLRPSAITSDIMMPGGSGFETLFQ